MHAIRLAHLLVVCCAIGAAAAEPVRPERLRDLSADEARQIVDACRGKGYIYLRALETLSAEAAAELARHGEWLNFDNLQTLTPEAAAALEPFRGRINLDGLKTLSDEAAINLGRCRANSMALPRLATLSARGQDGLAALAGGLSVPALRTLTSGTLAERLLTTEKNIPPGLVEISTDAARVLARMPGDLRLNGLTSLSEEAAGLLANRPGGSLSLRGLKSLSPEVARALVPVAGPLILDGLESVTPEVAEILAARRGGLSLGGLRAVPHPALLDRLVKSNGLGSVRSLPDDVLKAVAAIRGDRALDGLTELTAAQAEILGGHEGPLSLNGLTSLSDEAARGLLRHQEPLQLANLTEFSPATLALIMQHQHLGQRWINELRSLTPTTARLIAGQGVGRLSLRNLTSLSADAALALAESAAGRVQALHLDGLTAVSTETAEALARFGGQQLSLGGVKQFAPAAAAALAKSKAQNLNLATWFATIDHDTLLTPEFASLVRTCTSAGQPLVMPKIVALEGPNGLAAARGLATMQGIVMLPGLTQLSPEAAVALAAFQGRSLSMTGLTSLSPEAGAALVKCRSWDGNLPNLRELPVELAQVLAGHRGQNLVLTGLTAVSPETLGAIAAYKGGQLHIGVKPLTPEAISILAACDVWQPDTSTLATLTPAAARALVNHRQWNGTLPAVTGFDSPDAVEIAGILARRVGPVVLPGLKRISPRTLLTLIEKEDVYVPLVENLELIPEPDGSPTDDIVLPQKFLDRQERQRQSPMFEERIIRRR